MPQVRIAQNNTCATCSNWEGHRKPINTIYEVTDWGKCKIKGEVYAADICKNYKYFRVNILFIAYGVLGDHIICFRSLQLLKEKNADCEITFVGNTAFADIAIKYGSNIIKKYWDGVIIDRCIPYNDFLNYTTQRDYKSEFWEGVFKQSNIIVNHRLDDNEFFANNLIKKGFNWIRTKHINIDIDTSSKILLQDKVKDETRNAYAQVGELIELIGITTDSWQTVLEKKTNSSVIQELQNHFNTDTKEFIAFHPGSSTDIKNYPIEKWAIIINRLLKQYNNYKLLVFIGSHEEKIIPDIIKQFKKEDVFLVQKDLINSLQYLSICKLFLGHDTGFAHISASFKLSSVLLFGEASLKLWIPPYKNTKVLFSENIKNTEPSEIFDFIVQQNYI